MRSKAPPSQCNRMEAGRRTADDLARPATAAGLCHHGRERASGPGGRRRAARQTRTPAAGKVRGDAGDRRKRASAGRGVVHPWTGPGDVDPAGPPAGDPRALGMAVLDDEGLMAALDSDDPAGRALDEPVTSIIRRTARGVSRHGCLGVWGRGRLRARAAGLPAGGSGIVPGLMPARRAAQVLAGERQVSASRFAQRRAAVAGGPRHDHPAWSPRVAVVAGGRVGPPVGQPPVTHAS
jgi:hypothetical protein